MVEPVKTRQKGQGKKPAEFEFDVNLDMNDNNY